MIYFLAVIATGTLIFTLFYKAKIISICPICAGVVITWGGGIMGLYTNQTWADSMLIAILMGTSLGALAEKYGSQFGLLWKTFLVLLGLPAIYFLVQRSFFKGLGLVVVLGAITILWRRTRPRLAQAKPDDLFKECC